MSFIHADYNSPLGKLIIVADDNALHALFFEANWLRQIAKGDTWDSRQGSSALIDATREQLTEYFNRKRTRFNLPYALQGTDFQQRVWKTLEHIPFGETRSYKQQAIMLESPKAVRAIGRTNGLNPICIVLPCHRVVGSDGSLTGYAGGLEAKRFLLELEQPGSLN